MDDLCHYAERPLSFIIRYLRHRPYSHAIIFCCVLAAVGCAVSTQYGVKFLVDSLIDYGQAQQAWLAFFVLIALIAGDNLLWRLASWIASYTFPSVTCDLRRDLFRHLTGHSPSYFMDRMPGMLTSRITATSNAVYMLENMFIWNVLPPCLGTFGAIALVLTVSGPMAALLVVVAAVVVVTMFRLAAAGKPLHHDFADKTAASTRRSIANWEHASAACATSKGCGSCMRW
jgi:ATP-binding cassette subfamily B protein